MPPARPPVPVPESLVAFFQTLDACELEAREDEQGRPVYPFALKRRRANNKGVHEEPVVLRTPTVAERTRGTVAALKAIGKLIGRSPADNLVPITVPQAIEAVGEIDWDTYRKLGLASMCIRDDKPGYPQHQTVEQLADLYGLNTIDDALSHLDTVFQREDPRIPAPIGEDLLKVLVAAIAKAGDLGPLDVIAGDARDSFVISMACLLARYLTSGSSPPSSETSTPPTPSPSP